MLKVIIRAKFREDTSSNERVFHTLDSDCSVCMAAICYSGPISAVPTKAASLLEKYRCKISDQ